MLTLTNRAADTRLDIHARGFWERQGSAQGRGGGTLGISGWGCTAVTPQPLTYTRASPPILE